MNSVLWWHRIGAVGAALILAGCAARKTAQAPAPAVSAAAPPAVVCTPTEPGSRLVGTWQSNTRPRGVAGEFSALIALGADGTMAYTTQLKIGKRIRPGLREAGSWQLAGGVVTLQTTRPN